LEPFAAPEKAANATLLQMIVFKRIAPLADRDAPGHYAPR
jgi:hypothetical protein